MNIKIQRAKKSDLGYIKEKVRKYWLDNRDLSYEQFFVARKEDGKPVGFIRYFEYEDFYEPSTLAVDYYYRGKGIAKLLFEFILAEIKDDKPIYIITHIPDFFTKYGFKATDKYPLEFDNKIEAVCKLDKSKLVILKLCR